MMILDTGDENGVGWWMWCSHLLEPRVGVALGEGGLFWRVEEGVELRE